uniref:Universal stress protein n=1 Tax=Candidatus Methanomethylicus mesodigestus TaxID=1867258 RepID=A0A7C3J550_9CREN
MYPTIMVGVDGSKYSEGAFKVAAEMARSFGSKLTILAVFLEAPYFGFTFEYVPPIPQEYEERYRTMLEQYAEKARSMGVRDVDTKLINGLYSIGSAIVREAEATKTSLIVVGTRGLTGIKRTLLGSVADYVVKNAHCDVHIVRSI